MGQRKTKARSSSSRAKSGPPRSPQVGRARSKRKTDRGGRPKIQWIEKTAKDVQRLAKAGNTLADMAEILGVAKSTLTKAIGDSKLGIGAAYRKGCATRRSSLRTAQNRLALGGNPTMLIWLGKQDLGQRDVRAIEVTGPDGDPVRLEGDLGPVAKQKLAEFLRSRGKKHKVED